MTDGSNTKPFKFVTLLLWVGIGIVCLMAAFAALLPSMLSSTPGRKWLSNYLLVKYGVQGSCNRLEIRWFGHLEATDLTLLDAKRKLTFRCDVVKSDAGLWDVLFKKNLGHLDLNHPYLKVTPSLLSLFPSLAPKKTQRASFLPLAKGQDLLHFSLPYVGTMSCIHGKVELSADEVDPILFDEISMHVENSLLKDALTAHVECKTLQKGMAGTILVDATGVGMNTSSPNMKAQAHLTQLPVQGLDELLSLFEPEYNGLLVNGLGNTADLSLNGVLQQGNFQIDLSTSSPLLNGQLSMATNNGIVSLKQPAEFTYTLTPAFFRRLLGPRVSELSLQRQGAVHIALTQFSAPIPDRIEDLRGASFDAQVTTPSSLSFMCTRVPMEVSDVTINIASNKGAMQLQGKGSLESDHTSSSLNIAGSYNSLTRDTQYQVQVQDLPTDVIGQIAAIPALSSYLGSTITINASKLKDKNDLFSLQVQSPRFTLQKAVFDVSDRLTLRAPAAFSYALTPESMPIAKPAMMQGKISTFSFPLQGAMQNAQLELQASLDRLELAGTEPFVIEQAQLSASARSLDQISLALTSTTLKANATGKYEWKTGKCTLLQPLKLTATIDNALLHRFVATPATLLKPADLKLTIDPFSFIARPFSMQQLTFKGAASVDQLSITPFAGSPEVAMQNLSLPFQWDGVQKTASLGMTAGVQAQQLGSLSFKGTFTNVEWNQWDKMSATALLEVQKMPTAFVDSLTGKGVFSPLLGPQFNTTVKILSTPQLQNLGIDLASSLLNLKSAFAIQGNRLTLASPAQIQWTLTPEGYKTLDRILAEQKQTVPLNFELKEPSRFQASITKLELPLAPPADERTYTRIPKVHFDVPSLQLIGECSNPSISLLDTSANETIAVTSLALSVNKSQNAPMTFSCQADITSQNKNAPASKTGSISLKGAVDRFFDDKGQINLQNLSSDIALQIKSFPSRLLDLLARFKGRTDSPFTKIFGNTIQATLTTSIKNLSGPLALNINSPNMRFSLDALAKNGALLLQQPIYAQMKVTKEMSTLFVKEVNPLGLQYFYSENPVTIEIPAKGFYLPLHPFNPKQLTVPSARIELGKIACRNEGNVNVALGLLKTKQFDKNKEMQLWFAPMDLHINKGTVDLERTEILLAQTFDIAIWGQVYLEDNYVDMLLGLTAQTLSKAFGIKGLPDDYVLIIPMKGPADNVQINSSKATAKIALLIASQQKALQDQLGKSSAGAVLGGLIKGMATLPDSGKAPPAKRPYPWEKGTSSAEDEDAPREKMVRFKQNEKPLKQLMKVIK